MRSDGALWWLLTASAVVGCGGVAREGSDPGVSAASGGATPASGGASAGGSTGSACTQTSDGVVIGVDPVAAGGVDLVAGADGGSPDTMTHRSLEGEVTSVAPSTFTLHACGANADCTANSDYQITLDAPDLDLPAVLVSGSVVHVEYSRSCFRGCSSSIAVTSLPSALGYTNAYDNALHFYVSADEGGADLVPFPYAVTTAPLDDCKNPFGASCGGGSTGLYGFQVSVPGGSDGLVRMGETLVLSSNTSDQIRFRNLRSFQSDLCDDYAEYAHWATVVVPEK